ncbi:MAG: DUF2066 domain-containing protein [Porticoccaceae bacterium]
MKRSPLLKILSCLPLALALLGPGAYAVTVSNLYQAQVPVSDQEPVERSRALREGLAQVLVKVTGNSAVLANPEIAQTLANAEGYVTEYGYVGYAEPGSDQNTGLAMNINYSEAVVDRLVRRQQLQIWPADRPEMLVWMVVDTPGQGRQFVSYDERTEMLALLSRAMKQRGAPLLVPLLDLEDRAVISEEAVWNFDAERLTQASARYNASNWMAVRLYQSSTGQWRGARLLKVEQTDNLRSLVADSPTQLIDQLVAESVDSVASRYAFVPQSTSQELALDIEHVESFAAFSAVTEYLESMELVRNVMVDSVNGDRLALRVAVDGDVALLLDTLRRDSRMTETTTSDFSSTSTGSYLFRWTR